MIGEASVLENVMIGAASREERRSSKCCWRCPGPRDEGMLAIAGRRCRRRRARGLAHVRADRLQHSEPRRTEIARALDGATGSPDARRTGRRTVHRRDRAAGSLITEIGRHGAGVPLVEHDADRSSTSATGSPCSMSAVTRRRTPADIRSQRRWSVQTSWAEPLLTVVGWRR